MQIKPPSLYISLVLAIGFTLWVVARANRYHGKRTLEQEVQRFKEALSGPAKKAKQTGT